MSNMCNSTSDLLVTHTLTQTNRPSRLQVGFDSLFVHMLLQLAAGSILSLTGPTCRIRNHDPRQVTSHWSGNKRTCRAYFACMLSALPLLTSCTLQCNTAAFECHTSRLCCHMLHRKCSRSIRFPNRLFL